MKRFLSSILVGGYALSLCGQAPDRPPGFEPPLGGPAPLRDGGPGPGGPGGPMRQEVKLVPQFDKNGDKQLNATERKAAREFIRTERAEGRVRRGPGGFGGPRGRTENSEPPVPGPRVSPADAKSFPDAPLYASNVVRTLFLDFESVDWEKEMEDFHNTDVEVPAKLAVDGKVYRDVGVHFRGASSYMMVGTGRKRSLNVSLDFVHKGQSLYGHRALNLLNSHGDPSFIRTVLYSHIARRYIPAPAVNHVRVVINGESWGIYINLEQFNKDFVQEWFGTTKGARWKVPGSPRGRGGLEYLGDDAEDYKRIYEIKSKDDPESWSALIRLCKVLNETPANELEKALSPLLDIESTLKFLALENVLVNNDGYWVRASDYNLYQDTGGRFHLLPHDLNETFARPGGPGFGRGPGGRGARRGPDGESSSGGTPRGPGPVAAGVQLDPLVAVNDSSKPLLSKLLAVPSLRARYLGYVRDIAKEWLDWKTLGPLAARYHSLIADGLKEDTRKLSSLDAFQNALEGGTADGEFRGPSRGISLKDFADERRAYLLNLPALKDAGR